LKAWKPFSWKERIKHHEQIQIYPWPRHLSFPQWDHPGCLSGLAEHFDFKPFWVRAIVLIIFLASGVWPMLVLYFVAALLMKPEPIRPIETEAEQEFYDSYTTSRERAASRLKRRYQNLEQRIRRMEDTVTAREFEWDRKFNRS